MLGVIFAASWRLRMIANQ